MVRFKIMYELDPLDGLCKSNLSTLITAPESVAICDWKVRVLATSSVLCKANQFLPAAIIFMFACIESCRLDIPTSYHH